MATENEFVQDGAAEEPGLDKVQDEALDEVAGGYTVTSCKYCGSSSIGFTMNMYGHAYYCNDCGRIL